MSRSKEGDGRPAPHSIPTSTEKSSEENDSFELKIRFRHCGSAERDLSDVGRVAGEPNDCNLDQYITLSQAAELVGKTKGALAAYKVHKLNPLPPSDIKGGNGRADEWREDVINLFEAILSYAILSYAKLSGANLFEADLGGADFANAKCSRTSWGDVDLSSVKGLETVRHDGPSTIGVDTLYKSQGQIPEVFLRGCGVAENLIEYLPSLVRGPNAIQFYSCFISYSHADEEFAKRLHSRMRDEKLRVWFAPEDIKGGKKIHEQIDQAIRIYDKLLLVLSENSMKSEWVKTEIYHARQREINEHCRILFPIRLVDFDVIRQWRCFDTDTGQDLAREIREYFIPDFSNWKEHDSLESAFARLLQDLTAETELDDG